MPSTTLPPIELHWSNGNQQVVVSDQDQSRYMLTVQDAAAACARDAARRDWSIGFNDWLTHLHRWAQQHRESVRACYAGFTEGRLVVFVVPTTGEYDVALADLLSDLNREVNCTFPDHKCRIIQIPGNDLDDLRTFLEPEKALLVFNGK